MVNVSPFDVAVKIEIAAVRRCSQQFGCFFNNFVTFYRLFTDIQKADRGAFDVIEHRHQGGTEHSKLQQMLRRAVNIGAQIQHGGTSTFEIRHAARNRWALNAVHGFEYVASNRHQRTRIAGGYNCLGGTVLDLLDGDAHGRVFFPT